MIGEAVSGDLFGEFLQPHEEIVVHGRVGEPQLVVFLVFHQIFALHACALLYKLIVRGSRRRGTCGFGRGFYGVSGGGGGGCCRRGHRLLAGASGERVPVGGHRVVVLCCVGDDEHIWVGSVSLHLFSGQTPL